MAFAPTSASPALSGLAASAGGGQAAASSSGLADDFNTFLTLLTTQLQNQDPLDPTDSNEFTNQLVAFSGVEQQIRTNQNLETLADLTRVNNLASVAAFLGQDALVEGDIATNEGDGATYQYSLPISADETELEILDADGNIVFSQSGELGFGTHTFEWNGIDNFGNQAPAGDYRLRVRAIDADQSPIGVTINVQDTITEVETVGNDPVFTVGVNQVTQAGILRLIAAEPLSAPAPLGGTADQSDTTDTAASIVEELVNQ